MVLLIKKLAFCEISDIIVNRIYFRTTGWEREGDIWRMAIGDRIQNRFTAYRDIHTGVEVERLTEPGHVSHHMYFYNRMMTGNSGGS